MIRLCVLSQHLIKVVTRSLKSLFMGSSFSLSLTCDFMQLINIFSLRNPHGWTKESDESAAFACFNQLFKCFLILSFTLFSQIFSCTSKGISQSSNNFRLNFFQFFSLLSINFPQIFWEFYFDRWMFYFNTSATSNLSFSCLTTRKSLIADARKDSTDTIQSFFKTGRNDRDTRNARWNGRKYREWELEEKRGRREIEGTSLLSAFIIFLIFFLDS